MAAATSMRRRAMSGMTPLLLLAAALLLQFLGVAFRVDAMELANRVAPATVVARMLADFGHVGCMMEWDQQLAVRKVRVKVVGGGGCV